MMTPEELDDLYERIDEIARDRCHYEYGLPHDRGCEEDGELSHQDRIIAAIREAVAEAIERSAKVADRYFEGTTDDGEMAAARAIADLIREMKQS